MTEPNAAKAPRKRGKLIPILIVVVLLGGGAGGFWWWKQSAAAHAAAPAEPAPPPVPGGIVPLQPFLVNLADREASRFLRVTVSLVIDDAHEAKEIEEDAVRLTRVRSSILELLTTMRSDSLVTPEGKGQLKAQIAELSKSALHLEVRDVLFTDFVVQF